MGLLPWYESVVSALFHYVNSLESSISGSLQYNTSFGGERGDEESHFLSFSALSLLSSPHARREQSEREL